MAMSDTPNPAIITSRLGSNNFGSTAWENFVRLYSAEVEVAYRRSAIFRQLIRHKTIANGKSTTFPMLGRTTAEYFTPGNEIVGGKIRAGERTCSIDDLLISSQAIYTLDEAMNYYSVRSQYSTEAGLALAREEDRNAARMLVKAALTTSIARAEDLVQAYNQFDEEEFTDNVEIGLTSGDEYDASQIAYAINQTLKVFTEKDIPTEGLICVLNPEQYYALFDPREAGRLNYINRDFGGSGTLNPRGGVQIAGMRVIMSNNLNPASLWNGSTGVTSDNAPLASTVGSGRSTIYDMPSDYLEEAKKVVGLVFAPDAICEVQLLGMQTESKYQMEYQRTLMLSKMAVGMNILRPAAAVALKNVV